MAGVTTAVAHSWGCWESSVAIVRPGWDAARMARTTKAVERAVEQIRSRQGYLITRAQALSVGLSEEALRHRLRAGGPWKVVLPGIYLTYDGALTAPQREVAAALYAQPEYAITGLAALQRHGVRVPLAETVDVLIPAIRKRQSADFVRTVRTNRMPEHPVIHAGIRWAPAARAVADAARGSLEFRDVQAMAADAVQRGICSVNQLAVELREGSPQRSGALRAAIEGVADGIASGAEGDMRTLVKRGRLPEPMYNPRLYAGAEFIAQPDLWWRDAGVAGEVDSREWHLSPADWERTMARHARMSAAGIIVIHVPPRRIRTDGAAVLAEFRSAIEVGRQRPVLPIRAVPVSAVA